MMRGNNPPPLTKKLFSFKRYEKQTLDFIQKASTYKKLILLKLRSLDPKRLKKE